MPRKKKQPFTGPRTVLAVLLSPILALLLAGILVSPLFWLRKLEPGSHGLLKVLAFEAFFGYVSLLFSLWVFNRVLPSFMMMKAAKNAVPFEEPDEPAIPAEPVATADPEVPPTSPPVMTSVEPEAQPPAETTPDPTAETPPDPTPEPTPEPLPEAAPPPTVEPAPLAQRIEALEAVAEPPVAEFKPPPVSRSKPRFRPQPPKKSATDSWDDLPESMIPPT